MYRVKGEIFADGNTNRLSNNARPVSIPDQTASMDVDTIINVEHLQILLRSKMNSVDYTLILRHSNNPKTFWNPNLTSYTIGASH
jgi:hypothetical protein